MCHTKGKACRRAPMARSTNTQDSYIYSYTTCIQWIANRDTNKLRKLQDREQLATCIQLHIHKTVCAKIAHLHTCNVLKLETHYIFTPIS